ncbi:PREDICTED: uncharacterized protein LOC108965887 [Bactrocera latifrons]|uniref:uncharacterized protein LOC108965887 n=1 Tax=Bactrocera latifrons TaxID=174628 RepID=UPI0008DD0666|nr:PREDICTED: uncharacterized protein LOC108965887 [Bactrocera latifrons]
MGCTASNFSYDTSFDKAMPVRSIPHKRNFSSRVDCTASSGLSTEQSSSSSNTSERYSSASTWSSCSTPPPPRSSSTPTKKKQILQKRPAFLKLCRKDMPKALARLTLSDKQKPQQETPPPVQHKRITEHSIGYFTGSTDDLDSSCSSFNYNDLLLHTKDMNPSSDMSSTCKQSDCDSVTSSERSDSQPVSNLKMEILMMRENVQLMPKTSSPFCTRRDLSSCSSGVSYVNIAPPSDTYCLWRQYLQDAPAYSFGNVTAIPEAIAGQFSPDDHPAYTKLQNFECVSAPKRYRIHPKKGKHAATSVPLAAIVPVCGVTGAIISTEL